MNRFPVPAGVLAACLAVLTPSAAAEPDLTDKSEAYVSAYRAAYVACLEKSAGEIAKCEAQATSFAESIDARRSLVTAPADPVATSTPTGKVSTGSIPAPLPTEGIEQLHKDYRTYTGVDAVIRVPVDITNFRALRGKTIKESNPVNLRCTVVIEGGGSINFNRHLDDMKEGERYVNLVTIDLYQDLYEDEWPEGARVETAHCSLWADNDYAAYCADQNWDQETSFCRVNLKADGTYVQSHR